MPPYEIFPSIIPTYHTPPPSDIRHKGVAMEWLLCPSLGEVVTSSPSESSIIGIYRPLSHHSAMKKETRMSEEKEFMNTSIEWSALLVATNCALLRIP